jgi:hypothetical protein
LIRRIDQLPPNIANDEIVVGHYAAAFIDLLGQRADLADCGLLPDQPEEAQALARKGIAAILWLHDRFETYFKAVTEDPTGGDKKFDHPRAQEIRAAALKYQRFSDGLLFYVPLLGPPAPAIVNGLYGLLFSAGALCFQGLMEARPLRGGIAVAWGAELHANELYGCVMARAYELESKIAQCPRIAVDQYVVDYLKWVVDEQGDDLALRYSRQLAAVTLSFLAPDTDGQLIVDYLGAGFRKLYENNLDSIASRDATRFITEQLEKWRLANESKLVRRYEMLRTYFASRGVA